MSASLSAEVSLVPANALHLDPASDEYYQLDIVPNSQGSLDVFIDWPSTLNASASSTGDPTGNKIFVGRLDLEKLGVRGQLSRRWKRIKTVYVTKPERWGGGRNRSRRSLRFVFVAEYRACWAFGGIF